MIHESIRLKEETLKQCTRDIERSVDAIVASLKSGGKLIVFGNGGSASDSQHIAAELVGRFKKERKALCAISLASNTSLLTALANDYGYDVTFARQVDALAGKGDVCLGISTSGKSRNVLEGVVSAKKLNAATIGLLGGDGGSIKSHCDISIVIPSKDTPRIQECHMMIGHIICELIEDRIFA